MYTISIKHKGRPADSYSENKFDTMEQAQFFLNSYRVKGDGSFFYTPSVLIIKKGDQVTTYTAQSAVRKFDQDNYKIKRQGAKY